MVLELVIIAAVLVLAVLWVRSDPGSARTLLDGVLFTRMVLFGLLAIALALVLIFTGIWWLVLVGALLLLLIVLYVLIFEPHRDVSEVLRSWI